MQDGGSAWSVGLGRRSAGRVVTWLLRKSVTSWLSWFRTALKKNCASGFKSVT